MTKRLFPGTGIFLAAALLAALAPRPLPAFAQDAGTLAPPATADAENSALPPPGADPRAPGLNLPPADSFTNPQALPITPNQPTEAEIRERAYDAAITGLMPLRPDDIRGLLQTFDKTRQAVETPVYPYPEPEIAVETVSLDPGARPPEVKVATGHVTTITMLDVTGSPWPIQDMSWAGNFEIQQPEEGGHVLRITPLSEFTYGNISIRMLKLKTPVTLILKTHRDKVHYRFDARIPEYGPMAQAPLIEGGLTIAAGGDLALGAILDGVPPPEAVKLEVSGVDSRTTAYMHNALTYVRTPLTLLSPGWTSSVSSADGMKVYALTDAPVLLLSDQGKMVRARVGRE